MLFLLLLLLLGTGEAECGGGGGRERVLLAHAVQTVGGEEARVQHEAFVLERLEAILLAREEQCRRGWSRPAVVRLLDQTVVVAERVGRVVVVEHLTQRGDERRLGQRTRPALSSRCDLCVSVFFFSSFAIVVTVAAVWWCDATAADYLSVSQVSAEQVVERRGRRQLASVAVAGGGVAVDQVRVDIGAVRADDTATRRVVAEAQLEQRGGEKRTLERIVDERGLALRTTTRAVALRRRI